MNLRQALEALHRAGRIRSPWLPGMVARKASAPGIQLRVTEVPWPGPPDWEPCVTDPATVGCLMALAREASGSPGLHAHPPTECCEWRIWRSWGWTGMGEGPTEGAAWAAALIAITEVSP